MSTIIINCVNGFIVGLAIVIIWTKKWELIIGYCVFVIFCGLIGTYIGLRSFPTNKSKPR